LNRKDSKDAKFLARIGYDATQGACYFGVDLRIVDPGIIFILSFLSILSNLFFVLTGFTGFCRIFILFSSFLMKEEKPNPPRGKL